MPGPGSRSRSRSRSADFRPRRSAKEQIAGKREGGTWAEIAREGESYAARFARLGVHYSQDRSLPCFCYGDEWFSYLEAPSEEVDGALADRVAAAQHSRGPSCEEPATEQVETLQKLETAKARSEIQIVSAWRCSVSCDTLAKYHCARDVWTMRRRCDFSPDQLGRLISKWSRGGMTNRDKWNAMNVLAEIWLYLDRMAECCRLFERAAEDPEDPAQQRP